MNTWKLNRYELLNSLGEFQRLAGVDPETEELLVAYARIKLDTRKDPIPPTTLPSFNAKSKYSYLARLISKNPDVDERFIAFLYAYAQTMIGRRLPVIYSVRHLAEKKRISESQLRWIAGNQQALYRSFTIPKSNGSERQIDAPTERLLTLQRWIQRKILLRAKPHKYAAAFIPGKSVVDNATVHAGREVVVRIDLKDFFPSIKHRSVRKVFEQLGYPYRVSVLLANLCTLNGRLPQGAPTSPSLSNMVSVKMDRRFAALARRMKFRYSRYADDMVFSSNHPKFTSLIPLLREIIEDEGYVVNEKKLLVMRRSQRQSVTGLVVNELPGLSRKEMRLLRAIAHRKSKGGDESIRVVSRNNPEADPANVFDGRVSYAKMVDVDKVKRLKIDV